MGTSIILILVDDEEKQKLKERLNLTFPVIEELGDFFYLQEELLLFDRLEDHFRLEEYFHCFATSQVVLAFSSNFSRSFWSSQLKQFQCNFDSIEVFNLHLLKECNKLKGKAIVNESFITALRNFLVFWDKNLNVQTDISQTLGCDFCFMLKPMGLLRLEHYKQLSARYDFKFFYLEETKSLKGLRFFYEHCFSLVLKEVLGLFHDHQSSRHSSR